MTPIEMADLELLPADDESHELGRSDALAGVSGRLGLDDLASAAYWAGHDAGRSQRTAERSAALS